MAAFTLLGFTQQELDLLPAADRQMLDVLCRRRLRQRGDEPGLAECLRIRQQFEQYCDNRSGESLSLRLSPHRR